MEAESEILKEGYQWSAEVKGTNAVNSTSKMKTTSTRMKKAPNPST